MMKSIKLDIRNTQGRRLYAVLEQQSGGQPSKYAIFAHCFTCSSEFIAVREITRALTQHGFGVVRFDFTGLGKSEGDFAETNFSGNIEDIICVSEYLAKHYHAPSLLVGHSLGGAAVLMAASKLSNIDAVATIAAPAEARYLERHFGPSVDAIETRGEAPVDLAGRTFTIKKQFLDDIRSNKVLDVVKALKKPLLILHSPQDRTVSIDNAAEIYHAAFHPKSFISLDGADHLLSNRDDARYVADVIGAWVGRYINSSHANREVLATKGEDVAVHLNLQDNFTSSVSNGRHTIVADEPESMGGDDLGLSPYDLLNASLGACTAMTLKLYAERKSWPLEEVFVYLSYTRKKVTESEGAGSNTPHHLIKRIELVGELDDEQRQRLIEIAAKCPVHRTLAESAMIETSLVDSSSAVPVVDQPV